jgi:hypothetical protein
LLTLGEQISVNCNEDVRPELRLSSGCESFFKGKESVVRNKYQREDRKFNYKFEVVRGQLQHERNMQRAVKGAPRCGVSTRNYRRAVESVLGRLRNREEQREPAVRCGSRSAAALDSHRTIGSREEVPRNQRLLGNPVVEGTPESVAPCAEGGPYRRSRLNLVAGAFNPGKICLDTLCALPALDAQLGQ